MTTAATYDELSLRRYLGYSAWLHIGIALALLAGIFLNRPGNAWGGVGGGSSGSTKVSLVASAGIPMPQPTVPTTSQVVDPTTGLYKEEPKPKEEPKTDATNIPKFEKEKPLPPSKKSKVFENKTPPPDNAIRYGQTGQMNVQTGYADSPGAYSNGVAVQGQGGDFAARYGWYVESVKRGINQNWIQTTIDPAVRAARRAKCSVTFRIYRNGTVGAIRLESSSGNRSMDDSATRALLSIDKFPALPSDYSGTYVDVTIDFDLSLTK